MNERQRLWLGSGLVLLQFGLLALLALLAWPAVETGAVPLVAWAAAAGALLLFGWTLRANRLGNFNIHPRPRVGGTLVTSGPYAWIRHPMYSAFLLGTFALARTGRRRRGLAGLVGTLAGAVVQVHAGRALDAGAAPGVCALPGADQAVCALVLLICTGWSLALSRLQQ